MRNLVNSLVGVSMAAVSFLPLQTQSATPAYDVIKDERLTFEDVFNSYIFRDIDNDGIVDLITLFDKKGIPSVIFAKLKNPTTEISEVGRGNFQKSSEYGEIDSTNHDDEWYMFNVVCTRRAEEYLMGLNVNFTVSHRDEKITLNIGSCEKRMNVFDVQWIYERKQEAE